MIQSGQKLLITRETGKRARERIGEDLWRVVDEVMRRAVNRGENCRPAWGPALHGFRRPPGESYQPGAYATRTPFDGDRCCGFTMDALCPRFCLPPIPMVSGRLGRWSGTMRQGRASLLERVKRITHGPSERGPRMT